jgi:glycosyltransferase involved in cell wall biosynthesis
VQLFSSNLGYARGNNGLAKQAHGDVLVFLNGDVQLIPGWLDPIQAALASWSGLGVVGNIQLSLRTRETDHAGMFFDEAGHPFHFRPPLVALENLPLLPVPAVTGACLAISRDLFTALAGFDESYQNGYEDVDLCLRARATGAEIVVATRSVIWHYGCSSPGRHSMEETNAQLFESRWSQMARSLNRFQPPNLTFPSSRAKDHPAFKTYQTLQVFFPAANGYDEARSSVHLFPMGRWARIEIPLPESFAPSDGPLRLDPGWEPGTVSVGGFALRFGQQRELAWQRFGPRLGEHCSPAGTCRQVPSRRGLVFESVGEDPQLHIRIPQRIRRETDDWFLEVWLRGGSDRPVSSEAVSTAPDRDCKGRSEAPPGANSAVRVLVDLTRLIANGEPGGIKPALLGMFRWFAAQADPPLEFVYVTSAEFAHEVALLTRPVDKLVIGTTDPSDLAARERCDVVYCPFGITEFACPGIPTITLIVDLIHRDFPVSVAEPHRSFREECLAQAVRCSDWFLVISNFTAARLEHYYGIPPERILRLYCPVQGRLPPISSSQGAPSPKTPFFFFPANAWAHKNHETLLIAYVLYRQMVGPSSWSLVLTGHEGAQMARVRALSKTLRLDDHVQFCGYVSEQRLAELWGSAGALVFPSLHEGFGIPLLEAMAHGVPIVTHNGTAIPEVVGQAALLVDATNPVQLADAMAEITRKVHLRIMLAERGRRRVLDFSPDFEFGRLYRLFASARQLEARWKRKGYYSVDGLTDPVAIFALPVFVGSVNLSVSLRPLPANRTLQLWCGPDLVGEMKCTAFSDATGQFAFRPKSRVLTLRVPNASRLCDTDPRSHGVLLESLIIETAGGESFNLLGDK